MPSASSAPPAAAAASSAAPSSLGNNKGIKFQIKTGGARWECTLQDRSHERMKAPRSDSTDSVDSSNSSTTESK
ncbi:hypothetical protein ACHAPV_001716 [Trichoderma viride]